MKNKKLLAVAVVLLASLTLASCKSDSGEDETTAPDRPLDWHNSIEYEGSFYVDKGTKLLYSLDRGEITLWDDAGGGSVLQTLKYDSTAPDAMERMEHIDINGDGCSDIRIIYDESDGKRYNLWIWNQTRELYDVCSLYKDIRDPEAGENGTVIGMTDNGVLGTVKKTYGFNDRLTLTEISSELLEADSAAAHIAEALSLGTAAPAEGDTTIENVQCKAYTVSDEKGDPTAYLAYDPDGNWYIDVGALGFYRCVGYDKDVTIVPGIYTGEAGTVQQLAETAFSGNITIEYKATGFMGGKEAYRYSVNKDGAPCCYIVTAATGPWYISTDFENYNSFNKNTGAIEDSVNDSFAVKNEEN